MFKQHMIKLVPDKAALNQLKTMVLSGYNLVDTLDTAVYPVDSQKPMMAKVKKYNQ